MSAQLLSREQQLHLPQAKRILLVEDHDINRMLLSDYLGYCGYEVESLSKASDFFTTIDRFQPKLILLDLKLPEIDGYSLLEQIKNKPELCKIPIIVVSAFAFKSDRERATKLGACRYFVKPVNLRELTVAIAQELAN